MTKVIKLNFSFIYGILFGLVGFIIGWYISQDAVSDDYQFFYIYSTVAGFVTAWFISFLLNQRKGQYTNTKLMLTSIAVGLFSHWLCWHLIAIELNIRYLILDEYFYDPPANLFHSLYGVFALCLWSWMFFGLITVIGSIILIFLSRFLYLMIEKKQQSITRAHKK